MTVREVSEHFPDHAYTTVLTVLDRLERKGMVRRIRGARAHRYVPTGSRDEYAAALMREALSSTPDPNAALAFFAGSVSPEEAEVLRGFSAGRTRGRAAAGGPGDPERPVGCGGGGHVRPGPNMAFGLALAGAGPSGAVALCRP